MLILRIFATNPGNSLEDIIADEKSYYKQEKILWFIGYHLDNYMKKICNFCFTCTESAKESHC